MNTNSRKPASLRPCSPAAAPRNPLLSDDDHRENLTAAHDMLAFMRTAFVTDDDGICLSASAARGVEEMLQHIQNVMTQHTHNH